MLFIHVLTDQLEVGYQLKNISKGSIMSKLFPPITMSTRPPQNQIKPQAKKWIMWREQKKIYKKTDISREQK